MTCHNITMTNKPRKRAKGGGRKPKGPIEGNSGWLQARITEELRARLEQAAAQNGRSLSQEAQLRLQKSFSASAKLEKAWGPPDAKALAYLVSRIVRGVQNSVGANPFHEAGDLAWHRNPFTHAAVSAAITMLLAHYKPEGPIETPPPVMKRAEWVPPEQAETIVTPESVGQSNAMGLIDQLAMHKQLPPNAANTTYGENYHVLPDINKILGDSDDE
jgi:TraY domain